MVNRKGNKLSQVKRISQRIRLRHLIRGFWGTLAVMAAYYATMNVHNSADMVHCNSCTETIDSNSSSNYTLKGGEVLCITSSTTYTGQVRVQPDQGAAPIRIVNEGEFNARNFSITGGDFTFDNYGNAAPGNFVTHVNARSIINNYPGARFAPNRLTLRGNQTRLNNQGQLEPVNITIDNDPYLYNEAGALAQMPQLTVNSGIIENEGSFWVLTDRVTLNSGATFINRGSLTIGGELKLNGNSEWDNQGPVDLQGNLVINSAGVYNDTTIQIAGNYTVNGGGSMTHEGNMDIQGNFTVYGTLEGSSNSSRYGVVSVQGQSTLTGQLKGYLDVCDAGQPSNGTDNNWGSSESTVTYCVNQSAFSSSLPIELGSFEAKVEADQVQLRWQTLSETSNHYFTLERRAGDQNFEAIGRVDGAGNSSEVLKYQFIDRPDTQGRLYYRLKQTDFDGQFSYSSVIQVEVGEVSNSELKVYPNPCQDQLNLILISEAQQTIQVGIFNHTGQLVKQLNSTTQLGTHRMEIFMGNLPAGFYLIKVRDQQGRLIGQAQKVLKE